MPDVGGLVKKNRANVTNGRHIHNYSTFDRSLSYRLYNTLRFGDYTPSFNMEGVPNDEIQLNSLDRIDSLSLNAPFKGSIRKIKESFMVPNMAILPMQWDRIYAQNSNGDDVPDDANCIIDNFPQKFCNLFTSFYSYVKDQIDAWYASFDDIDAAKADDPEPASILTHLVRLLVFGEYVFSSGSLLNVCGYKANAWIRFDVRNTPDSSESHFYSYDRWFDKVLSDIFKNVVQMVVSEPVGDSERQHLFYGLHSNSNLVGREAESFRAMIELFRENPLCSIEVIPVTGGDWETAVTDLYNDFYRQYSTYIPSSGVAKDVVIDDFDGVDAEVTTLNLSRLLAYQLVCAHFYSNSSIDFIYSAELYRQYIHFLCLMFLGEMGITVVDSFSWNGMSLQYDYLSGFYLNLCLALDDNYYNAVISDEVFDFLPIWAAIFGYRKSLRYGDYFTASRPRPLAPINTDVAVNNSMVSVVDITRNIQAQRFANSVMRSRSKIEEYVKSLFGRAPQPDYHNPFFLTRSEEMIYGDEVQNTAESQITNPNSRTANFAGNVSPYTFTFHNDDMHPCIYIQIISFDIKRAYTRSVERQFLHRDRFDMFNPDFQYIGDQPIYGIELGYLDTSDHIPVVFSYTTRDMEYKQRFDQAAGGFVENLPGWCLTDQDRSRVNPSNLDPDFIRSYNTELDQFFLSLTGFSLGSYFHFTCITDNNVNAKRAMAVDPQILA